MTKAEKYLKRTGKNPKVVVTMYKQELIDFLNDFADSEEIASSSNDIQNVINWQPCDFKTGEGMPTEYGKYLICRKDGKIHWETFNGSGWAYNGNVIRYWAKITEPCL